MNRERNKNEKIPARTRKFFNLTRQWRFSSKRKITNCNLPVALTVTDTFHATYTLLNENQHNFHRFEMNLFTKEMKQICCLSEVIFVKKTFNFKKT